MQGRRRWLEAVAVTLQSVLLFGLGLAAWRSDPFGANREPEVLGGSGRILPLFVLPALGLLAAYTLGRWFLASQRKSSFGLAVAALLALSYGCLLLGGIWFRATGAQDTLTAAWIPWLVGYFLLLSRGPGCAAFRGVGHQCDPGRSCDLGGDDMVGLRIADYRRLTEQRVDDRSGSSGLALACRRFAVGLPRAARLASPATYLLATPRVSACLAAGRKGQTCLGPSGGG